MPRRIALPALLVALVAPLVAQREDDLVAHWRLTGEQFQGGAFYALYGQPPLRPSATPGYLGEGERQALVLPENWGLLQSPGRLPSDALPQRRITVEAWVAVDKVGNWGGFLGAIEDNGDDEAGWLLGYKGDRFCFGLASEGHPRLNYLLAPSAFKLGRWYHVAGVYDGDVQRLYVDGELVAEFAEQAGAIHYKNHHLLAAGAYKDSNEEYRMVGGLYELRLWDKALSRGDLQRRVTKMRALMPLQAESTSISGFEAPTGPTVRDLQPAINKAIDRGVAWLLQRQHRDGSFETHLEGYRNGMTALALYTLLKQGVPASHPGITNGLAYLRREPPRKTYSAGCTLLLLATLMNGDEDHDEDLAAWATEIVDLLIDWESGGQPGAYGYPGAAPDLSNTQYAALGLWAAHKLGVKTPKDLWQRLILNAIDLYQADVVDLEWEGADAGERTGTRKMAGFAYRPQAAATGSMTAAGLCILGTARDALNGKFGRKLERPAVAAERMAFEWLAENWRVDRSPGGGQHLYYLYGIERVGALFDTEFIGTHEWYRDGAEQLIKMQKGGGEWDGEPNTCFALLFLSRATASSTGPGGARKPPGWEDHSGDVWFRATGNDTLAIWVTGFNAGLLERRQGQASDRQGLRVIKIEYLVDGEVIAEVRGDIQRPWKEERYPARHTFRQFGEHTLRARAYVVPFGNPIENPGTPQILDSGPMKVNVRLSPEAFQRRHVVVDEPKLQVLEPDLSLIAASTELDPKNSNAGRALDGREASRWMSAKDDAFPWLRIELREPLRARGLRVSPAASAMHLLGACEVVTQVKVLINGEKELLLRLPEDGVTWATLEFERELRIRSLELRVVGRELVGQKSVGFSEVVLLGEPPRRRRGR